MTSSRTLLSLALALACASCSIFHSDKKDTPNLPAPPPPVMPGGPAAAQAPPPRQEGEQPVSYPPPRNHPPRQAGPAEEGDPGPGATPASAHPRDPRSPATMAGVVDALEARLAENPRDIKARRQLLLACIALGDWPKADEQLAAWTPSTFDDRLSAAIVYYHLGASENGVALHELEESMEELRAALPFSVRTACFCERNIPKPGQFHRLPKAEFVPGEGVCLYLSFENFSLQHDTDGQQRVSLGFDYRILDPEGREIPWKDSETYRREFTEVYQESVRDLVVPLLLSWPKSIGAGTYVLQVTVTDHVGGKSAVQRLDFKIK